MDDLEPAAVNPRRFSLPATSSAAATESSRQHKTPTKCNCLRWYHRFVLKWQSLVCQSVRLTTYNYPVLFIVAHVRKYCQSDASLKLHVPQFHVLPFGPLFSCLSLLTPTNIVKMYCTDSTAPYCGRPYVICLQKVCLWWCIGVAYTDWPVFKPNLKIMAFVKTV